MKKGQYEDLTNKTFNGLTAKEFIEITYKRNKPFAWWKWKCICGAEIVASSRDVKRQHRKSCGCLNKEAAKQAGIKRRNGSVSAKNSVFKGYIRSAIDRNIPFKLTRSRFEFLCQQSCFYCGVLPNTTRTVRVSVYTYNGVDRKNNSQGYTVANCVTCCKQCNYAKRGSTRQEFLNWVKKAYQHNFTKTYNEEATI